MGATFLLHGMLFASWTAHIPAVQERLGVGNGSLGTALLGAPVGSIVAMLGTGWLIPRHGSRTVTIGALVGYCTVGVLVGFAGSTAMLFAALLVWGLFQGALDVAMNAQGTEVEAAHGGHLMSGFHGFWSIGALTGAAVGAACAGHGVGLSLQAMVLGAAALVIGTGVSRWLLPDRPTTGDHAASQGHGIRLTGAVLVLGGIALASMVCEGAVADWSAVYLHTNLHAEAGVAGLGYVCYAVAMVVTRFCAAPLFRRVAPNAAIPVLTAVAAATLAIGLAGSSTALVLAGLAAMGLGLATVVPTAFSAASALPGLPAGVGIASVSSVGWVGFVAGPPLIGHLSQVVGLRWSLTVLPFLALLIAALVRHHRPFTTATP